MEFSDDFVTMDKKRVLLMYISQNSGHHHASISIENALKEQSKNVETLNINSLKYTNPILGNIINRTYMSVIKRRPEVWGYLYNNPKLIRRTQKWKESVNRHASDKLKGVLESFNPHAVVCTQAFPCGIMAEYKRSSCSELRLFGVLTDYAPHLYWIYDLIDGYFVPSEETGNALADNGIPKERIKSYGIPIDPKFNKKAVDKGALYQKWGLSDQNPVILLMGGSQGLGPIKEMTQALNKIDMLLQIVIICGDNKKLYNMLKRRRDGFRKKTVVLPYIDEVDEIMEIADMVITKPGGITMAEALAKGLCIVIVDPIPGQEAMNTDFLLKNEVAIEARSYRDAVVLAGELLRSPERIQEMRRRAKNIAQPDSAIRIAEEILERIT